jgi:hypothetical protein
MNLEETYWLHEPDHVADGRRLYAVVALERTAGDLRALLEMAHRAEPVDGQTVLDFDGAPGEIVEMYGR